MATLAGQIQLRIQVVCGKCRNTKFTTIFGYHVCNHCGYGTPTAQEQFLQQILTFH